MSPPPDANDPTIPLPCIDLKPPALEGLDPQHLFRIGMETLRQSGGPLQWQPPSPAHLAQLLPQFQIEDLLGRGGMGAVYKGRQLTLDRPVAIKLLPAEVAADPDFIARFQREARTLARLQHPGIVAVYEFGQTMEGHLFFVMEFVDGTDLAHLIHGPGLLAEQSLEITVQICEALQYAHGQGVMHRDIKPANVLITKDGRAKLADFGLARPVEEETAGITRQSIVMGTLGYMAPEQRMGTADHRADIFSLGIMFYEMLTGRTPEGIFDPPSKAVQVDVRLDEVVVKALQQLPERRYQQASEMKTDVDHIRTTALPVAPPPAATSASKLPLIAGVLAGGAALVLAALVVVPKSHEQGAATPAAPPPKAGAQLMAPSSTVSIPGLPDLPPLTIPAGEPGMVKEFEINGSFLIGFQMLPDSRRLLAFPDGSISLIDLETETTIWVAPDATIRSSAISQDGSKFATFSFKSVDGKPLGLSPHRGDKQGVITLRRTATGDIVQRWVVPTTSMGSATGQVALSPSGKRIVARVGGEGNNDALFLALEEGNDNPIARWSFPGHNGQLTSCIGEDTYLSTGTGVGGPVLLKIGQPGQAQPLPADTVYFNNAISPDKKSLVSTYRGASMALWDVATSKHKFYFEHGPELPNVIQFAGNQLVLALGDEAVRNKKMLSSGEFERPLDVWDRHTGVKLATFKVVKPDQRFNQPMGGADNGSFCIVRATHYPVPASGESNLLQIWRLPKPGQVQSSAKTGT